MTGPPGASSVSRRASGVGEVTDVAQSALDALAVPELAFPLVALGLLGLACSVTSPGLAWAGWAGGVLLPAGGAGLVLLPASAGAVLLLALAAATLCLEVSAFRGVGLHAVGGGVGLTLAGLTLEGDWTGAHPAVVVPSAAAVAAGTYLAARRSPSVRRRDPFAPPRALEGQHAVVLHATGSRGHAVVCGELWTVRCPHEHLHAGQTVCITGVTEEYLTVEVGPPPSATL